MPIYEYRCSACNKTIEAIQKFSDPPLESCSECGGKVQRIVSKTSFQLKGTGWYASDYKKPSSSSIDSKPTENAEKKTETPGEKATPKADKPSPTSPHKCSGGNCH